MVLNLSIEFTGSRLLKIDAPGLQEMVYSSQNTPQWGCHRQPRHGNTGTVGGDIKPFKRTIARLALNQLQQQPQKDKPKRQPETPRLKLAEPRHQEKVEKEMYEFIVGGGFYPWHRYQRTDNNDEK